MGEGRGGGDVAEDRTVVKKEPSEGAYRRARIRPREMTEAEKRLWQMLRLRQTGGSRFRRQVPIGRFIADFVCHAARLMAANMTSRRSRRQAALGSWKARGTASCGSGTARFWTILRACSR